MNAKLKEEEEAQGEKKVDLGILRKMIRKVLKKGVKMLHRLHLWNSKKSICKKRLSFRSQL